jgi:HAD superfamily hydrolase (TIGR01509 family)
MMIDQIGFKLPKILLVIFDCDGVLVDSEYLSATMLIEVFAEIGITLDLPFVYANFVGHSFATVASKYARLHGTNVPENFEYDYRVRLLQSFEGRLKAMANIETVLDSLMVPYCLASGSSPTRVKRSLEIAGLINRFEGRVFTTNMVKRGKPEPDIFFHAAKAMNVHPHNCLVVEDSTTGVTAAKAAGMLTWQFTGGVHFRHGYECVPKPNLVDRRFDRMDEFYDEAPELRRLQKV